MKRKYIIGLLLITLGSGACKKLNDLTPMGEYTDKTVFSTKEDVESAITGCYVKWQPVETPLLFWDCFSDNAVHSNIAGKMYESFAAGTYEPTLASAPSGDLYNYVCINNCNWFLENIDLADVDLIGAAYKARIIAEARFLRAYRHALLAQFFRDVPLVLHTQTVDKARVQKQASQQEVFNFVLAELEAIVADLPVAYTEDKDKGRITRGAALALKARIELFTKKYDACIATCNQLMSAPFNYSLYANFQDLFRPQFESSATNNEVILDAQYMVNYAEKKELYDLAIYPAGTSSVVVTPSLVDAFETMNGKTIDQDPTYNPLQPYKNRDPRLAATVIYPGQSYNGITFDPITPPGGGGGPIIIGGGGPVIIGGGEGGGTIGGEGGGTIGGGGGTIGGEGGGTIGGGGGTIGGEGGGTIGGGGGTIGGEGGGTIGGEGGSGTVGGGGATPVGGGTATGYTLTDSNYKRGFRNSRTGYNFKKYLSVLNDYWNTAYGLTSLGNTGGNVIVIRYAEVLLTYAEAKIESGQIDQSVYDAINKVRERAGMPQVNATTHSGQTAMRELVRRERRVELAGEGLRWFDIVRWQIGPEVIKNVYDCLDGTITKNPLNPFAEPIMILTPNSSTVQYSRTFTPKYYVLPIPQKELTNNFNLVQHAEYR
ncbi:RagB/SusD family nutrient uptake outer membrane protein [Sphingobacterium lumbrici]|uniref:RagB/SusD family nutrient uptake outer membrane protein n=1 Tax=Sphingobacterium lumbrici TaxID=2559600 RepID=UPI00112D3248|nr:RagB/SusD family nutrient uptake outer membrane protein [Sphingobacterium lumbrici]